MTARLDPITASHALHTEMQQWRRDIHQHPETAYEEFRTSERVAERLRTLGLEVHTGIGETGVVGILRGNHPGDKHIGLRADMDALPLTELNTFAHASCHHGKMHGCGHDGHTTMLLGAATILAQNPDFAGTVYFIFQPAEESNAGAKRMIEAGLFERFPIAEVYGMHNWPGIAAGQFAVHPGAVMASTDGFDIEIHGKGGHAAMPDMLTDPVLVAGHIITATQSIVARNLKPTSGGVISITRMVGGSAYNVIPETVTLHGTIRSLDCTGSRTAQATPATAWSSIPRKPLMPVPACSFWKATPPPSTIKPMPKPAIKSRQNWWGKLVCNGTHRRAWVRKISPTCSSNAPVLTSGSAMATRQKAAPCITRTMISTTISCR